MRDRIELAITAQIKALSYSAINQAVSDYIDENATLCDEIIDISLDQNNKVSLITEDIYIINSFKSQLSESCQKLLQKLLKNEGIDVKLGNFTGMTTFCDAGPYVHFDIESRPTVQCELKSSFETCSVNQSLHHITLFVYADIYIGNPIRIESIEIDSTFEIAQTVIVGEIPSTYGLISRY